MWLSPDRIALTVALLIVIGIVAWSVEAWCDAWRPKTSACLRFVMIVIINLVLIGAFIFGAQARDLDGRYAASPLKPWFDGLRSGKGPCCSDADGSAVADVDWDVKDKHYRVRIEDQWIDVPDDAVITEPNRAGRTMVWPIYYRSMGKLDRVDIRCFMPGSMG